MDQGRHSRVSADLSPSPRLRGEGRGEGTRILAALAVCALAACATESGAGRGGSGADTGNQVGAPIPALRVESLSGKKIEVASYRGRVLLLDVWASWCGP